MIEIELVIKIPEEIRLALINNIPLSVNQWSTLDSYIEQAVINGTPLPKGHGDLTDKDILAKRMIEYGWHHPDSTVHEFIEDDLPTIIEADKEKEKCN